MHNEYKGFYRVMRRKCVREVQPVVHESAKKRWEDDAVKYPSPALSALIERFGWNGVHVVPGFDNG